MDNMSFSAKGLCKSYKGFAIKDLTLELPRGVVMGLVGANGAGKTTLIRLLLGLAHPDSGNISLLDGAAGDIRVKEKIGVVFDELPLQGILTPLQAGKVMSGIYSNWDAECYAQLLRRMDIPENKDNKSFSRGMRMKLALALALSHNSELLLLDEPTGGLDPIMRTEILALFREFMQDESHSILISSHITSDLENLADYVAYIDRGRLLMVEDKDKLLEQYAVVKGRNEQLKLLGGEKLMGLQSGTNGFEALIKDRSAFAVKHPELLVDRAGLDTIMNFIVREARKDEGTAA